jgi:ribulose-phosphate 3-epimerase
MPKAIRIVPAVLTDKPAELSNMLQKATGYTDFVQIDIMDGRFVPSRSIGWQDIETISLKPAWEAHLLIVQPEKELANYRKAGAEKAIFHYEAAEYPEKVIETARSSGLKIGMAINPETTVQQVLALADKLDSILFMSVHPGFYGAQYIPEVLDKVKELHRLRPELPLGIDGGINERTWRRWPGRE